MTLRPAFRDEFWYAAKARRATVCPVMKAQVSSHHQGSICVRFLPARGGWTATLFKPRRIQRRVSAGSITSSISSTEAVLIAFPRS